MLTPWVAGLFPVPHSPRSPECSSHSWRAVARAPFIEPVHDSDAGEIDHHHVYFSPPWSIPSPHTGKETMEKVNKSFPQASQWANNVRDGIWAHACLIPKCVLWICSNTLSSQALWLWHLSQLIFSLLQSIQLFLQFPICTFLVSIVFIASYLAFLKKISCFSDQWTLADPFKQHRYHLLWQISPDFLV